VLGIGATGADVRTILFTGLAGLLAGALSMAAGEYVSVRSQRELLQSTQPDPESQSALPHLDVDANELALVYRARGMQPPEAEEHARTVLATLHLEPVAPQTAGVDPHEAVGSAWRAAVSSFCFFAAGAWVAVVIAAVLVGIALLGTGAVVGLLSGASPLKRALRQLAIGYGAAAATYLLSRAFSTTVG
jgi:vacuolar iron transporter family protein